MRILVATIPLSVCSQQNPPPHSHLPPPPRSPPQQTSRWGLEVDRNFRVKGVSDGSVWALGDCAVR